MSNTMNYASLLPGRNPAGTSVAGDYSILPATGSTSGQNPLLPPTNLPSGAPASNPYDPTSVVPSFGANSGAYSPTSLTGTPSPTTGSTALSPLGSGPGLSGMTPQGLKDMYHELNKTYGEGTASAIMNFLSSGAGFNQDAINNIFAALQPGYNRAQQQMINQFSTSGNRFGSGAQIGLADLQSQQQLNMGEIEAQMYETSVSDYINTLMGVANRNSTRIANSPSLFEQITSPITDITGQSLQSLINNQGSSGGGGGGSGPGSGLLSIVSGLSGLAGDIPL